jgi:hypothetical protein
MVWIQAVRRKGPEQAVPLPRGMRQQMYLERSFPEATLASVRSEELRMEPVSEL